MTHEATNQTGATDRSSTSMFEVLESTADDVVAIRVGAGTTDGYRALYDLLAEVTAEYGAVHVYEEVPSWTLGTCLSHVRGVVLDLLYGSDFDVDRYAAVGDSAWARLLYYQWRAVAPVWPVAPGTMRYYSLAERDAALEWVRTGDA